MQIFCWQACNEALLTIENLYNRKILELPLCFSCGKANETAFHALWECEKIHAAWGPDFNSLRKLTYQPLTVMDLICKLGQEGRNVELFTVMAWFIWCRRNKCHVNEPSIPVDKLPEAALKSLSEFQGKQPAGTTHLKPTAPKWQPPPKDTYKINYDSAIFSKSEEAGIGVVIRNERGEVMASLAKKVNKSSEGVEAIEAMAARRAI